MLFPASACPSPSLPRLSGFPALLSSSEKEKPDLSPSPMPKDEVTFCLRASPTKHHHPRIWKSLEVYGAHRVLWHENKNDGCPLTAFGLCLAFLTLSLEDRNIRGTEGTVRAFEEQLKQTQARLRLWNANLKAECNEMSHGIQTQSKLDLPLLLVAYLHQPLAVKRSPKWLCLDTDKSFTQSGCVRAAVRWSHTTVIAASRKPWKTTWGLVLPLLWQVLADLVWALWVPPVCSLCQSMGADGVGLGNLAFSALLPATLAVGLFLGFIPPFPYSCCLQEERKRKRKYFKGDFTWRFVKG